MEFRSFSSLNASQAWRRVRSWAQSRSMDVADRLPYEVLDRIYGDEGPPIRRYHEPQRAQLVISSKKSGTVRPFVRVRPTDLVVYQALVDQLAPAIENALPPREYVGAYRQVLTGGDAAFHSNPSNDQFRVTIRDAIAASGSTYVLESDISGYFLGVRLRRLSDALLTASDRADAVYDLVEMLQRWQQSGVRGLPQGIRPSSPLGNFYLASLDSAMGTNSVPFYRWMDDIWAICGKYSEARRIQDHIERHLYGLGLTLNGEKTRIVRAETAIERLEPAANRLEQQQAAAVQDVVEALENAEYLDPDDIPEPEDIEHDILTSKHDELVALLGQDSLPSHFYTDMSLLYRSFEKLGDPYGLDEIPRVLVRAPDLSNVAMRYAASLAAGHGPSVRKVFSAVLSKERFARDFEKLNVCHRALKLKPHQSSDLAEKLADFALKDRHALIRAKALVAWGRHAKADDFGTADRFLRGCDLEWRVYALVAIQDKAKDGRDKRYEAWAGEGAGLGKVTEMLQAKPIAWSKL
jgi:hypothetical protein